MSRKLFTQFSVLVLFLLALLATPLSAQAGGVCGGTWTVAKGETLDTIAAMCGTTVSAITAANPGISASLSVGQVIVVQGSNSSSSPSTPVPGTGTSGSTTVTNNYYTTNNYYDSVPSGSNTGSSGSVSYNGTYIVQYGDTFSGIASRFGVSISSLWAANPSIWNINLLYVGQAIYVPGWSSGSVNPTVSAPKADPVPLTAGTAPKGTPNGEIRLSNRADADVYVSLQGTMSDGSTVIHEYPVSGNMTVKVPAGWYGYVAWVGGVKFTGQFKVGGGFQYSITFYSDKVVVQ